MRLGVLFLLTLIPGIAGVAIFGYYTLVDWGQLDLAFVAYQNVLQNSTELSAIFKAEAAQNIHRINVFADGVWTLLSAILSAIGIHAWYVGGKR
jgi:hypothetical protein